MAAEGGGMIALLALLLSAPAPENFTVVARKTEKPGFFKRVERAVERGFRRLYEKDDPDVARGNGLAAEGKPEEALKEYDKARERLPDSAPLSLNRAGALLKMDAARAPEAASEASQALQHGEGKVKSEAAYDLALATEAMGRADDAIKAYAAALALDPADEDAKANLELLLKTQEERKKSIPQQQSQESKEKNDQKDQQQDKSKGGQDQKKEEEKQAGDKKEELKQQDQQQQQAKQQEKKEQVAAEEKPVDRSEAERLLDALRSSEKNLQAWRFAKDKRKEARHGDAEKDW